MAGMFVPQMVTPTNTSGLAALGERIGEWRQESAIADVLKGLDPADPHSRARILSDLRARGDRTSREMADRLEGSWNTQAYQQGQLGIGQERNRLAREEFEEKRAATRRSEGREEAFGQQVSGFERRNPIPSEEPGPPPPAPAPAGAPAPARVSGGVFTDAAAPRAPDTATEAAAAAAGPVRFGEAASPVPGTNVNAARAMLGTQPLAPLPPPPPRNLSGTGAAAGFPPAPVPVPTGAPLPSAPTPAPLRASGAPTPPEVPAPAPASGAARAPTVGIADLVSERSPPVPTPPPPVGSAELMRQIQAINAMRPETAAQQKWQERAIRIRENELKNRTDRQNDAHKAAIEERKGRLGKDAEHAFKRADKISEQALKDNETAAAITQSQALIKQGIFTGQLSSTARWTANLADTASQIITKMGGDPDSYETLKKARDMGAAMTLFNGLAAKTLHGILGGFGAGITNVEGARLDAIVAGLPKDLAGNQRLLEYGQVLIGSRRDAARAVQEYLNQRYRAGAEPTAAHIDEIQRRYADHAIARIEAAAPKVAAPAEAAPKAVDRTPASVKGMGRDLPTRSTAPEGSILRDPASGDMFIVKGGQRVPYKQPPAPGPGGA